MPFRLFNKRITGYLNLRFHRKSVHKPFAVKAAAREIRRLGVDHVVITGDVTNLALEVEFELVRDASSRTISASPPTEVSLVPGNHDTYTRGSFRSKRFQRYFEPWIGSDLPELDGPASPFVRPPRPASRSIGLSTAVPRPPARGRPARSARSSSSARRACSRTRRCASRTPVILQHHPWHNPPSAREDAARRASHDADAKRRCSAASSAASCCTDTSIAASTARSGREAGHIDAVGATSASLLHDERRAHGRVQRVRDRRLGGDRRDLVSQARPEHRDVSRSADPEELTRATSRRAA